MRVLENKMLREAFGPYTKEVKEDWRKLHNEEFRSLRRRVYEPNAVFWVVQSFQNRKNVDWWSPKWTTFHVNRRRSHRCSSWFDCPKSPFDYQRDSWSHVAFEGRRTSEEGLSCGWTRVGCCTTTMHQLTRPSLCAIFWRKTKRPLFPSHPTLQIWLQRTFFCLESTLKGRRFDTFDEIQKNSKKALFAIPKEAFQSWQKRWERRVASEGHYFEGDKLE